MKLRNILSTQVFWVVIFILTSSLQLSAQANIKGRITDAEGTGIPTAYIFLEGTDYIEVSDLKGDYQFFNIPSGNYQLTISYIGYENQTLDIHLVAGQTLLKDIVLNEGVMLNEVVINGRLEGQAKALNIQKNKLNITQVIASEQIERFPDANIGDALKRVSGINVQYDQGEARFANIRGTAPELNSVTINGERLPSAEAEKRYVQLDLIPADMVGMIELNKAVTPDMDGDAIGGSINLVTKKASTSRLISGTLGSGYSFLTNKPIVKGKLSYSNRFANNKLGVLLKASMLDKHVRSDNMEAEWDYDDENNQDATAFPTDLQVRQYELQRLRQSYAATLDYIINENHSIYTSVRYTKREDWENRYRLRFKDIEATDDGYEAEIRRQTKGGVADNKFGRLEDQSMISFSGGGEHFLNKTKINWTLSAIKADEERPHERYISMRAKGEPIHLNLSSLESPSVNVLNAQAGDLSDAYSLKELTEEFKFTEEKDFNGRFDIEQPILFGKYASHIKFGARFKTKSKERSNQFKEYEPSDEDAFVANALANTVDKTKDDFAVEGYQAGSFVSEEFLGNIDVENGFESEDVLEELAGNFKADEDVYAAYLMYTQNIGTQWSMIAGLRYEQTQVSYSGKIFDGETLEDTGHQSADYSNLLPGFHLKYSPSKWTNLRFAWTNTFARPNYFDLVPYQNIETDDNRIEIGNPTLEATTSSNLDILAEHFFKNVGSISAGVFYKGLNDVIATETHNDYEFQGNIYDRFKRPINAGDADLYGFEFGVQRRLNFLPGFLSNLSLYANYTFTESELKNITIEGRETEALPLVGTPKHLVNTSLAYDTKKFDLRLSYNFAAAFIEEYDEETFFDRWYDQVNYLDFNADYKFTDNWKVYVSVNNLLNQSLRYYQGVDQRTMQVEYYGVNMKLGVKFKY